MEHWWNDTDSGKPKYSENKPIPVPLCSQQIPHSNSELNRVLEGDRLTNYLTDSTVRLNYKDRQVNAV
jgi:hypothetical protein